MGEVDLLGLVVEDRLLDRPPEELVGVAAEKLVEGVLAGDVHREPRVAAPGAPPHLAQARHGAREGHAQGGVEVADVDAELERVGRHHGEQVALGQALLDLAPLRRGVAGPVGRDALGQVAATRLLEPRPREALDQLDAAARVQEADRPHLALDELGEQRGCLRQRGGAPAEPLVDERWVPHCDLALCPRGAVAVDELELEPGQALGELERVGDRRAREHEARLGSIRAREPAQAAQHVGDVRAEHAAVDMRLVDHDPGEVGEHIAPGAVVGQDAHVQHVRIREHEVRALADLAALLPRRVAVVDRVAEVAPAEAGERAGLVLCERLGRIEVEGARGQVGRERVEHGQVERERLAARGACRDDRVAPASGFERVRLVGPERLDSHLRETLAHGRMEVVRQRLGEARLRAFDRRRDELLVAPGLENSFPGVRRPDSAHGLP